jgi:hypothetical protein
MRILSKYYFAGRKVNVNNVSQYRLALVAKEPNIQARAEAALEKFRKSINTI